jgi:hypothetical protein
MIIDAGSHLKDNIGICERKPFLVHYSEDVKRKRRLIHLGTFNSQTSISQFLFVYDQQIPRALCF